MTFKEKLVRLRKIKGLTQDEFANAVGVSRQAVYKWESGQSYPEVAKLLEIKALFEISIDDLLDDNYEVALPEKKKRKRATKQARVAEEASVIATESAAAEVIEAASEETAPEAPKEEAVVAAASSEQTAEAEANKAEQNASEAMVAVKYESKKDSAQADDDGKKKIGFFGRIFGRK